MKTYGDFFPQERIIRRLCLASALLSTVVAMPLQPMAALSQEPQEDGSAPTDEKALRRETVAYRDAVENGDLDAVAKYWTPDADYVDHLGHAFTIQTGLAAARDRWQKDGRIARPPLKTETLAIRFVSPDVAMEDGIIEAPRSSGTSNRRVDTAPFG